MNPFITQTVTCPICQTESSQNRCKTHLFIEQDLDIDLRPRTILRRRPGLEDYHPPNYYMWHCPSCHFTAGHPLFDEPIKGTSLNLAKFRQVIKTFMERDPKVPQVIAILSEGADRAYRDHFMGLKMYYLGIYFLQMIDRIFPHDSMNLGRYCLRLSWLYRDIGSNGVLVRNLAKEIAGLIQTLLPLWPLVPKSEELASRMAVEHYEKALEGDIALESEAETVELFLLISRLHLKLGHLDKARLFWSKAMMVTKKHESGTRTRQKLARQAGDSTSSPAKEITNTKKRKADGARMNHKIEEVKDLIDMVLDDEWDRQARLGREILDKAGPRDPKELRLILRKAKLEERVVRALVPEKKKGGILGVFR